MSQRSVFTDLMKIAPVVSVTGTKSVSGMMGEAVTVNDPLADMKAAFEKIIKTEAIPCGDERNPHVVHPKMLSGPCIHCGAMELPTDPEMERFFLG